MNPSRLFILRPVATALAMVAVLLAGWVAWRQLPLSALPQVDYPTIQVVTLYPGASPEVVTSSITAPLEPAVIVAGAGSGKTTVMAARVVWLVGTGQLAPEEVLGLTFTNKAAKELLDRVRSALVKAGLAGGFAYNRLKASAENAKGDPLLSKAVAPLTAGIESLKGMATKLRNGEAGEGDIGAFESVIDSIKNAGKSAGAEVTDKVPSTSQLTG